MDREEQRDQTGGQGEEGTRAFEKVGREVRERQSPSIGEEGTEEDRRQWEKTRDLHEEAKQISDKTDPRSRKEQEHQEG